MPVYAYRAKTSAGKEERGKLEANNDEHLVLLLRERRLYPLSYKKETVINRDIDFSFFQKVSLKDLTAFTRQFSSMISAGLTVLGALDVIKPQVQNKKLRAALYEISDEVKKGTSLSESMGQYPKVFPAVLINMVAAGEVSGKLDTSLERASEHFEKESSLSGKIKGALTYPVIVSVIAVIAVAFLVAFVIPGFQSVFDQTGGELPFTTRSLIYLSGAIKNYWYVMLLTVGAIIAAYKFYTNTPRGREAVDKLKLKIPVFGPLNVKVSASRFARTLAIMLESGLPLLDALEVTGRVVDNYSIEKKLDLVREEVSRGAALSVPLERLNIFPNLVTQMVIAGENTGEMEELLKKIALFYDDEVDLAAKQLTTALEPAIILFLGVVISFIVLAILQPMFSMYENVGNM